MLSYHAIEGVLCFRLRVICGRDVECERRCEPCTPRGMRLSNPERTLHPQNSPTSPPSHAAEAKSVRYGFGRTLSDTQLQAGATNEHVGAYADEDGLYSHRR